MEFKNTKVSDELLPEGVTQLYQGHVVKSDAVTTDQLAERVSDKTKIDLTVTKNVISAFGVQVKAAVAAGERPVIEGVGSGRFSIEGSFDSEDDVWDETRNAVGFSFVVADALKGVVADIVPTNVLSKVQVQLLGAQDAATLEQNTLTLGNTLLCQGKNLTITEANADEGLFLVAADATEYKATITGNTAGTIDAMFGTDVPAGTDYTLVFRGRGGNGTNRSLVSAKIADFTVKAA